MENGCTWLRWPVKRRDHKKSTERLSLEEIAWKVVHLDDPVKNLGCDNVMPQSMTTDFDAQQKAIQWDEDNWHGFMKVLVDKEGVVVIRPRDLENASLKLESSEQACVETGPQE